MEKTKPTNRTIKISNEVLCKVATLAVHEVEGVASTAPANSCPLCAGKAPVVIENLGGAIAVQVRVIVKDGYRAVQVANQVQTAVKQSIQDMAGVTAVSVDVEISGVEFEA